MLPGSGVESEQPVIHNAETLAHSTEENPTGELWQLTTDTTKNNVGKPQIKEMVFCTLILIMLMSSHILLNAWLWLQLSRKRVQAFGSHNWMGNTLYSIEDWHRCEHKPPIKGISLCHHLWEYSTFEWERASKAQCTPTQSKHRWVAKHPILREVYCRILLKNGKRKAKITGRGNAFQKCNHLHHSGKQQASNRKGQINAV